MSQERNLMGMRSTSGCRCIDGQDRFLLNMIWQGIPRDRHGETVVYAKNTLNGE